jgi:hypothetical protein
VRLGPRLNARNGDLTLDQFGIGGPLLALALVAVLSVRSAILTSLVPGLLATGAIL